MGSKRSNRHSERHSKPTKSATKDTVSSNKASTLTKQAATPNSKPAMPLRDFSQMRHRYYIVRPEPNKTCVPMVALDELPAGFRLKGVPMTVTPQQIQNWDMARVGADVELKDLFEVELSPSARSHFGQQVSVGDEASSQPERAINPNEATSANGKADAADQTEESGKFDLSAFADKSLNARDHGRDADGDERSSISILNRQANDAANNVIEKNKWEKENDRSKTQDAATPGVYGKKKYCTHWIRTGNCDYMQEGCRYLHVIPDAETRLSIGIRDMPRWAKEDLPSPPREMKTLRRRSWSPPKEKKDPHKDWRNRGNRKIHAELPAGPSAMSHAAPVRPTTPTPRTIVHAKQSRPQKGKIEAQSTHSIANAQLDFLAFQHPDINNHAHTNVQPGQPTSLSVEPSGTASLTASTAVDSGPLAGQQVAEQETNTQGSFSRQQQFYPSMSTNPSQLSTQYSHASRNYYGGGSPPNRGTPQYESSYPDSNYDPFYPLQSPRATPFDNSNSRPNNGRWGHAPHLAPNMNVHQFPQSRLNTPPLPSSSPMANPWRRNHFASPTFSFSEASVGTIGHGRPKATSPIIGSPILHRRLFRQPGESEYVQAKPEGVVGGGKPKNNTDGSRFYHQKVKGMVAFGAHEGDAGRSGDSGNLITFDE